MQNQAISIITVVFNAVGNIERSIRNSLDQTYENKELIIIDGGSTDGTIDVLKKYDRQIKWISEKDQGIYDAMNKGAQIAKGEWIIYHNCGDYFIGTNAISNFFANYIDANEIFITGNIRAFNSYGYKDKTPNLLTMSYMNAMPVFHPATFIRTSWQKKNPFNLNYRNSADYDLFIRLFKEGAKYAYIDYTLVLFDCCDGATASHFDMTLNDNINILTKNNASKERISSLKESLQHFYRVKWLCKYFPFFSLIRNIKINRTYANDGWIKMSPQKVLESVFSHE